MHSATKYLGGHGSAIAGVIVDGGKFDWTQGRHPGFTTPDPSYHGVVFADLGAPAYALKARVQLLRDLGSAASPFNAFLVAQGLETLSLRIERHVANAQKVAEFLSARDEVISRELRRPAQLAVARTGKKLAPKGTGAVLAFELAGGVAAGKAFVDALTLHSHVANIGDVRSLVIHPASTTHHSCPPRSSWPPESHRVWSDWRSVSKASTTSLPTSSGASPPPRGWGRGRCTGRGGVLSEPEMTLSDERVHERLHNHAIVLPAEGETDHAMSCPPKARRPSSTSAR